jgi:hypothetical protein
MPNPHAPGTMVYGVLDRVVSFFQEPKNQERIQTKCIDPLMRYILDKMFPYIILFCIVFSLVLLLSVTSVGILLYQLRHTVAPLAPAALVVST